jgi:hypothetical protein
VWPSLQWLELNPTKSDVHVSTTFHLGFTYDGQFIDFILASSDAVYFGVVSDRLLNISNNGFGSLLPASHGDTPAIPLPSRALNILLHAIYGLSPAHYAPSIADILVAVRAMDTYGIVPADLITPTSALFQLVVQQALKHPFECYALAADAQLEDLAISISSHTLSTSLSELPDSFAEQMGPLYLKRLFFLHLGRLEALKRILIPPPGPHPFSSTCDLAAQRKLSREWTMAIAELSWNFQPGGIEFRCADRSSLPVIDLSIPSIESALRPLNHNLTCLDCSEHLDQRIRKVLLDWSLVKVW